VFDRLTRSFCELPTLMPCSVIARRSSLPVRFAARFIAWKRYYGSAVTIANPPRAVRNSS
jgi:hypothetical protein